MSRNTSTKPDDLCVEPNKVKKKDGKKDRQVSRSEEAAATSDDLYAQPNTTKKKNQIGQQDVEQERSSLLKFPFSIRSTKKPSMSVKRIEIKFLTPPPYVPDEEQYHNTMSTVHNQAQ